VWINQIETWFGVITRHSIRRSTFTPDHDLEQDHDRADPGLRRPLQRRPRSVHLDRRRPDPGQVRVVQTHIKKPADNNAK
jgi:hypothetical protein